MSVSENVPTNNVPEPEQTQRREMEPISSLEKICNEIVGGRYDGKFDRITEAMDDRRLQRKAEVLAQVKEVFGPDAQINTKAVLASPEKAESKPNPFLEKAQALVNQSELLPGPYKIDATNGNAMRQSEPEDEEGYITITDVFGGHEMRVHKETWNQWEDAEEEESGNSILPNNNLIEKQMIEQGGVSEVPIEQRGAIIGGLSSSDIGD